MSKRTTKTGAVVTFDLTALPLALALAELQPVKPVDRKGAVIVDEVAGRPYAENRHQLEWRKVADAAGGPRGVWNMDARSGGATEAGADIQRGRVQSDPKTTSRYVRGNALEQGRRVAA